MFKLARNFFAVIGVTMTFGFIVACFDSSNADSGSADGLTSAEVQAMIDEALAGVATPRDTLYAPASSGAGKSGVFNRKLGAADWVDIGTRLECLPTNDMFGEWCRIISPNGYYFGLPLGLGETYPRQAGRIYFDQVGCTGNAYMYVNDVGPDANVQGFVTGYYPNGVSDPASVYMFQAGGSIVTDLVTLSYHDTPGTPCTDFSSSATTYVPLVANDPGTSGVSNENYGQLSMTP